MITLQRATTGKLVTFAIIEVNEPGKFYTVSYRSKECVLQLFENGTARLHGGFGGLKHSQDYYIPSEIVQNF